MTGTRPGEGARQPVGQLTVAERLEALERAISALSDEVRTGRLVITSHSGAPRLVAETTGNTIELRLEVPGHEGDAAGGRGMPAVVLHASDGADVGASSAHDPIGGLVGLQLWADGNAIAELDAWPGPDGQWHPHLYLDGGP